MSNANWIMMNWYLLLIDCKMLSIDSKTTTSQPKPALQYSKSPSIQFERAMR